MRPDRDHRTLHQSMYDVAEALTVPPDGQAAEWMVTAGWRSPWAQARVWRQSRTTEQVRSEAAMLASRGAPWLSDVLLSVGPQAGALGRHVTRALPGASWHQWGEALDVAAMIDGRPTWATERYQRLGEVALLHDVTWGGWWGRPDLPHFQRRREGSPLAAGYEWSEVDARMRALWGETERAAPEVSPWLA